MKLLMYLQVGVPGILLFGFVSLVRGACNPDAFKVDYIRECYPESNIKFLNLSIYLDKNCLLRMKGCVNVAKPYSEAKGKGEIAVNGMAMPFNTDLCRDLNNSKKMVGRLANSMGLHCPQKAGKVCANEGKTLDLPAEAGKKGMSGEAVLKTELIHNAGAGKSCFEMKFTGKK